MGAFTNRPMNFARVNRDYTLDQHTEVEIWHRHSARIALYQKYWRFYRGDHWSFQPEPGEPVTTANFVQKFVDKHVQYLVGNGFSVHSNLRGAKNRKAEDLLNENYEKNGLQEFAFEMAQVGGVTGDCWINVGLDEDPIFGTRVKYTVLPSEIVFPIFSRASNRVPEAILLSWQDQDVSSNNFGRIRYRAVNRGQYWTKREYWELENGKPVAGPFENIIGELPFVHIPNLKTGTEYWGRSDIAMTADLNREFNEKLTDISDIVNYHSAPVTIIYGAKASQLQKGARKVWSGLPKDARVENMQLFGDLAAANTYLMNLRQVLFELSSMTGAAFGGAEFISNTSGVALAIQFAPIIEHMKLKRITYGRGLQYVNYLTLRFMEVLGWYQAPGIPQPYYTFIKWPDPLPRDKSLELQYLQQMRAMQLLTRVQVLRQLIENDIAPDELEPEEAEAAVRAALEEEMFFTQAMMAAQNPHAGPAPGGGAEVPAGEEVEEGPVNSEAAAERSSQYAQRKTEAGVPQ